MICAVRSNHPSFKTVIFHKGYNIIVADRVADGQDSSRKTRNGAGKSSLIEIIHFCLGAQVNRNSIFKNESLAGWSFILDIEILGEKFTLERYTDFPSKIYIVQGNIELLELDCKYDKKTHSYYVNPITLNKKFLELFYGLKQEKTDNYIPSFRELVSYNIRRGIGGYSNPFEFFSRQTTYSKQVCNAYFLELNIAYASKFQEIKEKQKGIENYKSAAKSGVLGDLNLNIGELNAEVITRQIEADAMKKQLDDFCVLPQYEEISEEVNQYTEQIHQLTNALILKERLKERYRTNIETEEVNINVNDIRDVYEEAGVLFGDNVNKSLQEVVEFHKKIVENRKNYLQNEVRRTLTDITNIKQQIATLDSKRSDLMKLLETHGALEEYVLLQDRYATAKVMLEDAKKRLDSIEYIEDSKSRLKIENQELLIASRQDYNERANTREKAVALFKENTEFLYPEPGVLTIDLKETGYDFDIEIKSSRSQGVGYMKVFCYDMVLAELGKAKDNFPDFVVHDSTIFDGVDERQVARALMLADIKCNQIGMQYVCLINSDMIPYREFDDDFRSKFDESIVLRISDEQEEGGLLGIRF